MKKLNLKSIETGLKRHLKLEKQLDIARARLQVLEERVDDSADFLQYDIDDFMRELETQIEVAEDLGNKKRLKKLTATLKRVDKIDTLICNSVNERMLVEVR